MTDTDKLRVITTDGDTVTESLMPIRFPANASTVAARALKNPKPRKWRWDGVMPSGQPLLINGPPGAGKSLIAEMMCMAASVGACFYGRQMEQCGALYVSCEDDGDELTRRAIDIARSFERPTSDFKDCHLSSWVGDPETLLVQRHAGRLVPTQRYGELDQFIGDHRIGLVCLDLAPDFADINEIVRSEVNRLVKGFIGNLCQRHDCAIALLQHPSRAGLADGSGSSGSTAWEGSVRCRLFLTGADANGVRQLQFKKGNYTGQQEAIDLIWHEGALIESDMGYQCDKDGGRQRLGKHATAILEAVPEDGIAESELRARLQLKSYQWRDGLEALASRRLVVSDLGFIRRAVQYHD